MNQENVMSFVVPSRPPPLFNFLLWVVDSVVSGISFFSKLEENPTYNRFSTATV